MKERLRSWLPLIPLLLLLGAIYWLDMQVQPLAPGINPNLRHDPDYIIDNFTATSLNNQGKVRFVMSAKKMLHYPDDDTTFLTLPQLSSMTAEYPPVRMTAETGEISSKGEDVYLRKDVVIVRPAYADKSELTFNTSYLHVMPNKNIADTDQVISMVDAHITHHAVGMELDNNTHVVKFLSQVRTVYESPKK
ncbi:MAG: LPS export ABC transporter periplasmic protein LptC [Gallionellaceae bacterium]|jgi:lipopolysaccharide export system protein LptC